MMNQETNTDTVLSSRTKAAILLMSLDAKMPGLSQQLLTKMDESQSKLLLQEINQLGQIDKDMIASVVDEFYALSITQESLIGGKIVSSKLLKDSFDIDDSEDFFSTKEGLFKFLETVPNGTLTDFLKQEPIYVASLLLSFLPDARAADILATFPAAEAGMISNHMLTLDIPNYSLLWKFHQDLELHFSGDTEESIHETRQIFKLSRVLEMMIDDTRKSVMTVITEHNKPSAEKIKQLIFCFDDLIHMKPKDLGIMLVEIDPLQTLALAMQNISNELDKKLKTCLSERLKPRLDEALDVSKNATEDEIQDAQADIVKLCRKLEDEGRIEPISSLLKLKEEAGPSLSQQAESNKSEVKEVSHE